MIKGYIFDYGATLDTAGQHWGKKLWHAYERQQVPVTEAQFRDAYVYAERTLGNEPIIKPTDTFRRTLQVKIRLEMEQLMTAGAWNATEEEYRAKHHTVLEDVYGEVLQTTAHSRDVLTRLRSRGYEMVVVSNFYGNVETVLEEFGFTPFFKSVVESAVVGIRKPNPRIFTIGVQRLGLRPEEVMVVGDSFYKDIEPARQAGCQTAWFKGEGWTDRKYDETLPNKVITDLKQLLDEE